MTTKEAYEQAVKELCAAAHRRDHESLDWLAHTIGILWERMKQEVVATSMDAFNPHQVITLVNAHHYTWRTIKHMKDNPAIYGSVFRGNVVEGTSDG